MVNFLQQIFKTFDPATDAVLAATTTFRRRTAYNRAKSHMDSLVAGWPLRRYIISVQSSSFKYKQYIQLSSFSDSHLNIVCKKSLVKILYIWFQQPCGFKYEAKAYSN